MQKLNCFIDYQNFSDIKEFKLLVFKAAFLVLKPHLTTSQIDTVSESLNGISENSRMHPILFQLATNKMSASSLKTTDLNFICDLFSVQNLKPKVEFITYGPNDSGDVNFLGWSDFFVEFQRHHKSIYNSEIPKFAFGNINSKQAIEHLNNSFSHLAVAWPEMSRLTECLLTHICFLKSDKFESGCMMAGFGAVYLSPSDYWNFDFFIEVVVHEVSHLQMMLYEKHFLFLTNAPDISGSPLRKDLRPMLGVLHAVLALVRMTEVALRLCRTPHPTQKKAHENFVFNLKRLDDGIGILKSRAHLTEHGQYLLRSIEEHRIHLQQEFAKLPL